MYFRSLHLGNVVITPDGSLGLIDIADMQVLGSSISNQKRKRNFLHLFRYSKDIEHLWRHREEFINAYCENLSARKSQNFSSYLKDLFTKAKQDRVEERTP